MKHLKPLVLISLVILLIYILGSIFFKDNLISEKKPSINSPTAINAVPIDSYEVSLFYPYWTLPSSTDEVNLPELPNTKLSNNIYFGITATANGSINKNEPGYIALPDFIALTNGKNGRKTLALRMINNEINTAILDSQEKQNNIINEVVALSQSNGFDGVLLDLEISTLPTQKTVSQISVFTEIAGRKLHAANLSFSMTVYGDTYYRSRPYDLVEISKHVDTFYIMAYDLHKAGGNPGPNFPFGGREIYGYDFISMVADLRQSIADNQMTIVFGMYGYDWWVDEKRRAIRPATAVTLSEIREKFLTDCQLEDCVANRDEKSGETEINYVDSAAGFHVVWFEDEASAMTKIDHLAKSGIGSIGIWAVGYY